MSNPLTREELADIQDYMDYVAGRNSDHTSLNVDVFDCNGVLLGCVVLADGCVQFVPGQTSEEFYGSQAS